MDTRRRNLKDNHPVLVIQAVVVKVKLVMIQTVNTVIKKVKRINLSLRTKKVKQIV